jgi:hypothetical protein
MFASRPVVHPLEVAAPADPAQQPPGVLMKDLPGMPGTPGGLGLRVLQLLLAAISLAAMSSTVDFASVTAFRYATSHLRSPSLFRSTSSSSFVLQSLA